LSAISILQFDEALAQAASKRHLLLGNGFSIALKPTIFSYESLYTSADFSKIPYAKTIFDTLKTSDFEEVTKLLTGAAAVLKAYKEAPSALISKLKEDAAEVKNILVQAIAKNHPDRPFDVLPEQYAACRAFLSHFQGNHTYTLNYDVLLYWALMQDEVDDRSIAADDGFRHPEDNEDAPYVAWQEAHSPTVHYLHGALHLFDAGAEIIKYTWSKTDIPLLDQIRIALDEDKYPLFVSEGDSRAKLSKIMHNAYLHKAYRSFTSICDQKSSAIFIFGHSLADNDNHIFRRISRGRIAQLFVSVYGDPNSEANKAIIKRARLIGAKRESASNPLDVCFYDASSAKVWG
jgi:hypothetical protein